MAQSIQQLSEFFVDAFPCLNKEEQKLSLALYHFLSRGKPVSNHQLKTATDLSMDEIDQTLHSWPGVFFDEDNNVIGYWGLAIQEMRHRLDANSNTSFAWCAWDTLFIPELLGEAVKVESTCPVTGNRIVLNVSPTSVEVVSGKQVYVSFLTPDAEKLNADVTTSFCHFVYFFDSKSVAEKWLVEHPGTFLLTLDEAFSVARAVNTGRYSNTLN